VRLSPIFATAVLHVVNFLSLGTFFKAADVIFDWMMNTMQLSLM
jgi:hypothetical protein